VNNCALTRMSTALSSWRTRVKKKIFVQHKSFEELKKTEPLIEEDDYNVFKARCESDEAKAKSKKMKDLHNMNIGTHRLGPGGYRAAKHIWKKEDAELRAKGKKIPSTSSLTLRLETLSGPGSLRTKK
jgi:hypothetical protein